ncbi:MAG: hypothetical protein U0172_12275 [Nitrospiraceae bacterium]
MTQGDILARVVRAASVRRVWRAGVAVVACLPLTACLFGSGGGANQTTYEEARQEYAAALERDLRAGRFPNTRLVAIPSAVEPFKPGAAFTPGATKPVSHACIVSELRMPEAKQMPELWAGGQQPQFVLSSESSDMVAAAARDVQAVQAAITRKQPAMVSLADTTQLALATNDLLGSMRNETCLDAVVGKEVWVVQGIIYGAEALSTSKYLEIGAKQLALQNSRARVMYDGTGSFYIQETKVRPKYWMLTGVTLDLKVDQPVGTPAARAQALKAFVAEQGGELTAQERTLSDAELRQFVEAISAPRQKPARR